MLMESRMLVIVARAACVAGLLLAVAHSQAVVIYSEGADLSNNQAAPTPLLLSGGTNSVLGSVNGTTDSQDWIAVTVPAGFQLSSVVLASYVSTDAQGFTGFQIGPAFVGSAFSAASYTGYAHYGTGATNGPLPPTNLIGQDLLAIMANPSLDPGAQGFAPPLGAGTYTLLIQQLGATTSYQFDFGVTAVPCPAAAALGALAGALGLKRRR